MASLAHLKLFLELAAVVVPEVAPGALAVVVEGPGLEKALLEGPSQRWVVPVVAVALAEPTPSAGVEVALDPSPLPHCYKRPVVATPYQAGISRCAEKNHEGIQLTGSS